LNDQVYLPGVIPTKYSIFSFSKNANELNIDLVMKRHFAGEERIFKNHLVLSNGELKLYDNSIKMCKSVYYYSKWTLLPILIKQSEVVSIRIYFLETLINRKTSYMQYNYEAGSKELIGFERGFGLIESQENIM